jgi:hypothetical protein
MKKIKFLAIIIAIFAVMIGCGSSAKPASSGTSSGGSSRTAKDAKADELDKAMREISDYLNKRIPKGSKAVFLNIKSDWPDLSDYILSGLAENAVNDEVFTVVDRQQLDVIRSELNFQWSGEVSDKSAQEIGQMLGAQSIVSGSISTIGSIYRIQVRSIAVQTASVQGQLSQNVDGNGPIISSLTKRVVPSGSLPATAVASTGVARPQAGTPAAGTQPATPAAPAAPKTYAIGDTGPAGGLIFYDKKNNSGCWQYLEAAPVEAEFQAVWSVRSTGVENTQETIGSGKRNTQLIVEKFSQTSGEWDTAAQKADDLVFNKFDDWFVPSKAELDQMYGNLKRKNLGNFKNEIYWTSSSQNPYYASVQNFKDGDMNFSYSRRNRTYVRPIRQF